MKITPFFKWFDFWIGIYVNPETYDIYWCPIPMFGIKVEWKQAQLAAVPERNEL